MNNKLQIINRALKLVRQATLQDLNDNSEVAETVNLFYDDHLRECHASYPWSHALIKHKLSRTTEPVNEYAYAHLIPVEALRIWNVFIGTGGYNNSCNTNDYDIIAQGDNRVIVSDYEDIIAEYVKQQEEALWPPLFKEFVVYSFASKIAVELTQDAELAQGLHQMAYGTPAQKGTGGKFAMASSADVQQKPPTFLNSSPLTEARFRGGNSLGGRAKHYGRW